MKRLLLVACVILLGILRGEITFGQCGTTPISGDLIITANTSLSGTYNITGLFRVEPGVVCSVTPYTSGGCGELIINAVDIEVMGDIIGDGSGYPGGSGGAGATSGSNAGALTGCIDKDNCLVISVNGGNAGSAGSGPGAGNAGSNGTQGMGPKQECGNFGDDYGFVGGSGGAGGAGGGSYGGLANNGGSGGSGGAYNSGNFSGMGIAGCASPSAGSGGTGGTVSLSYGTATGTDIDLGSGGAGGGGGGKSAANGTAGATGGAGGGLIALYASGQLTVAGNISANGQSSGNGGNGGNGGTTTDCCSDACNDCPERTFASGAGPGGGAGGGSGGGILLQGYGAISVTGTLRSLGGSGGGTGTAGSGSSGCSYSNFLCGSNSGSTNGGNVGNSGGGGSGGRIKIFQNPCQTNVITPTTLIDGGAGFGGAAGIGTYNLMDIGNISGPTATTSSDSVSCYGLADGSATITISGGTAPLTYSWDDPLMQSTATATGLLAGTYSVTVVDSFGCEVIETVVVPQPDTLTLQVFGTLAADCFGASTGEASVTPLGGTQPYTYSWNDPQNQNTSTAVDLPAGTWIIDVVDANGCTAIDSAVIGQPAPFAATATIDQNVSCNGLSDGQATVSATGNNLSYTWDSSPVQTTSTASGLSAGTYNVTIASSQTCDTTITVTITEPTVLTVIAVENQSVSCNGGSDGVALATGQGGTPSYSYQWDDSNLQTTASATGLEAGTYNVVVTDANQCVATASVVITQATAINIAVQIDSAGCNGASDAQIEAIVTGGTPGYQYTWNPGSVSGNPLTGIPAGTYSVQVTDANNCVAEFQNILVPEPAAMVLSLVSQTNVSCNGSNDGSAEISAIGGTPGYTYVWDDPTNQSTALAGGLSPGIYSVTVTDVNGCTAQWLNVNITEPDALIASIVSTTPITCDYSEDGIAEATVIGGTTPYVYLWNDADAQTSSTAIGLVAGDYVLTVTDANGCTAQATATIDPPVFYLNADFNVNPLSGQQPMEITVTNLSEGGTAYEWMFGDGNTITTYDTAAFQFLYVDSGTFTLTLVAYNDVTGCTDTLSLQDGIYIEPTSELVVPNVITPNGDGINDMFPIDPVGSNFYPFLIRNIYEFRGEIYNRWGEKVYEWTQPLAGWDGHSTSGKELNNGTYYFVITAKGVDGDSVTDYQLKGDVTLIR